MHLLDKLKTMTIKQLCELFELTTEIERRNPEGFDKWLFSDAEDSTLYSYVR